MQAKVKNIVVTAVFALFIAFFAIACAFCYANPVAESESERRPLAQFPEELTWEGIVNGMNMQEGKDYTFGQKTDLFFDSLGKTWDLVLDKTVIDEFEDYSVDQFPFREFFRSIKANFQLNVLQLKENNGLAVEDGYIAKIEPQLNPSMIDYSLGRLNYIFESYLKDKVGDVYVSLIPDKNYFFGEEYGYAMPDYAALIEQMKAALPEADYIDIFDELELEDYYKTDTHWRQEQLDDVVEALGEAMGFADRLSGEYEQIKVDTPFYGVYHGQSALNPAPDTITYLTNDVISQFRVFDYLTNAYTSVYNFSKLQGRDGYDFFLSGSRPLLRIDNPNATTDEELVIFRDSFGSSLSPLLAEGYKSVYVIDIRYVSPMAADRLVNFEGKDVLFMYSALILNGMSFLNQP